MVWKLTLAWCLMAFCVAVHAAGLGAALRWWGREGASRKHYRHWTWLFVKVAGWIILLHLIEIAAWALLYVVGGSMPDLPSALYFSVVTYTTTGYGDLVLPEQWRLVGGVEALTGILMCGWSTGFFFAVLNRMARETRQERP